MSTAEVCGINHRLFGITPLQDGPVQPTPRPPAQGNNQQDTAVRSCYHWTKTKHHRVTALQQRRQQQWPYLQGFLKEKKTVIKLYSLIKELYSARLIMYTLCGGKCGNLFIKQSVIHSLCPSWYRMCSFVDRWSDRSKCVGTLLCFVRVMVEKTY